MTLDEMIQSAKSGNAEMKRNVAQSIVWEDETQPIDPYYLDIALDFLQDAIEAGDHEAMNTLGAMYYKGRGVRQDYAKSVEYYTKAAKEGNVFSMSNLGYVYYYGRNVKVDYEKAYYYFTKSALLGDRVSTYKVGDMYMLGKYVEKDPMTAVKMYINLFNQLSGKVETQDDEDVYSSVCLRIGRALHSGTGIHKDLIQAKFFLTEALDYYETRLERGDTAAQSGYNKAQKELNQIKGEMMN